MTDRPASQDVVLPRPDVIVMDIEGTLSSTWYAQEVLYPYAKRHFAFYLDERFYNPDVARARRQIIAGEGLAPDATTEQLVEILNGWLDTGQMPAPLRTLNAVIWQNGFAAGELVSPFFEDAIPALRRWAEQGIPLFIYSSGAVPAQRAWFKYSPEGNLLPLLKGHFDTETAGPKTEVSSLRNIAHDVAEAMGKPRERFVFFSDRVEELNAARAAGWSTVGVRRPGSQFYEIGVGDHPEVRKLDRVRFVNRYRAR